MKKILIVFLALVLTACLPPSGDVTPPIIESSPTPEYTPTVNPEAALAAWVTEQVTADISQQPYLQALEEITDGAISQACVDFATRLGAFEENLSANHAQYTFRVSADGICYVTTADGTVIVDAENNAGFLYLTPAIASQALGVEVARVSADGRNGSIGDAYDAAGRRVGGVSRLTMQWETVNDDGVLPSEADPSSVPPTPVNPEQGNIYQVNYAEPIDEEAQAQAYAKLVEDYQNGNLTDTSGLNPEQHAAFSAALAKERNAQTGINFISFTYLNDEEYFLNPKTLQPEKMPAEVNDEFRQENSFTIYSEVKFDAQGNVMFPYNGEWRTVPNSAGFDFSMEITDPNHPIVTSIDIPKITEGEFAGMTPLQRNLIQKEFGGTNTFRPGVTIKNGPGEIIFKSGKAFRIAPVFPLVTFETDGEGKAVLAKISLIMPSGVFSLYEEGEKTIIKSTPTMEEYGNFWRSLEDNQIYYIAMSNDPKAKIDYASHISDENIQGINLGHTRSDDVSVIVASSFIKPKD